MNFLRRKRHTCLRRISNLGPWKREENLDNWGKGRGLVGQSKYLSCSFCGSLNPETYMQWLELGQKITPTDKSYKSYVSCPNGGEAKFYFQHLTPEQKKRFVELHNENKIGFEYPGYLYTFPFFMVEI